MWHEPLLKIRQDTELSGLEALALILEPPKCKAVTGGCIPCGCCWQSLLHTASHQDISAAEWMSRSSGVGEESNSAYF